MSEQGQVRIEIKDELASITFSHPKSNSLPSNLLSKIANHIGACSEDENVRMIFIQSEGDKAFCAGASFDELQSIKDIEESKSFFKGFADIIIAMRKSSKIILTRVQGKVVGGGVGLVAGSDYVFATKQASLKLSELAIGIGPFIIGPVIEQKIGKAHYGNLALSTDWKTPLWGREVGLYSELFPNIHELDTGIKSFLKKAKEYNPEAIARFKNTLLEDPVAFEETIRSRVEITAELSLKEFCQQRIADFQKKLK